MTNPFAALAAKKSEMTGARRGGPTGLPGRKVLLARITETSFEATKNGTPNEFEVQLIDTGKTIKVRHLPAGPNAEKGINPVDLYKTPNKRFQVNVTAPVGSIIALSPISDDNLSGKEMDEKFFGICREGVWPARYIEVLSRKPELDSAHAALPTVFTAYVAKDGEGADVVKFKAKVFDTANAVAVEKPEDFKKGLEAAFLNPVLKTRENKRGAMLVFKQSDENGNVIEGAFTQMSFMTSKKEGNDWVDVDPATRVEEIMADLGEAMEAAAGQGVEVVPTAVLNLGGFAGDELMNRLVKRGLNKTEVESLLTQMNGITGTDAKSIEARNKVRDQIVELVQGELDKMQQVYFQEKVGDRLERKPLTTSRGRAITGAIKTHLVVRETTQDAEGKDLEQASYTVTKAVRADNRSATLTSYLNTKNYDLGDKYHRNPNKGAVLVHTNVEAKQAATEASQAAKAGAERVDHAEEKVSAAVVTAEEKAAGGIDLDAELAQDLLNELEND